MEDTSYDIIIIGCGIAGASLAWNLVHSQFAFTKMLIIDKQVTSDASEQFLSYWSKPNQPFTKWISHSWKSLTFRTETWKRITPTEPYRVYLTSRNEFIQSAKKEIMSDPRITFKQEKVSVQANGQIVSSHGTTYSAHWVFDSSFPSSLPRHTLYMHTASLIVKTKQAYFKPDSAIFFDFSTSTAKEQFCYLLPLTAKKSIVQSVIISDSPIQLRDECASAARNYLKNQDFEETSSSYGCIPLFQTPLPNRGKVIPIGLAAGMVKPSTGYGLTRIWKDSELITKSLMLNQHPYNRFSEIPLCQWCDRMFLFSLKHRPDSLEPIFRRLFQQGSTLQALEFLDGTSTIWNALRIMARVTPLPFIKSYFFKKHG